MNKPYVKPAQMTKPPGMPWRQYRAMAESLDREWNHELHSNAAFMQLLDFTCARLAKARLMKSQLEASGPRLMLPRVLVVASSKVPAKAPSSRLCPVAIVGRGPAGDRAANRPALKW